jgi:peptidoglycan/LPS O-acetylase OafA/YrhL
VSARLGIASWEPWFSYGVAIALALAAYYAVENPGRRWILKTWGHKRT